MKTLLVYSFALISFLSFSKGSQDSISVEINIYGIDLTEDMSRVSTKNDEILLLIYSKEELGKMSAPKLCTYFTLDGNTKSQKLHWLSPNQKREYILMLIEVDSENPIKQLEPVLRVHYEEIRNAYFQKNLNELRTYIGDNELLTLKAFSMPFKKKIEVSLTGVTNMDSYHYLLTLEK